VRLSLSIAIGNYDRVRPLLDGTVRIDGVDPLFMNLEPEEIFYRGFRHREFDICELSLSSFAVKTAQGNNPYVGVPVFPSRMFRHTAFYVRRDRGIESPEDLRGRRVGLPEYQLTACVWARIILAEDHGVQPHEIRWVRGGLEQAGREEKIALNLPANVVLDEAPAGETLTSMLESGEIEALVSPLAPSPFQRRDPNVGWLFRDPTAAARASYARNKIFPIMHVLGVRRTLVEQHPWLPFAILKAFTEAKTIALQSLRDTRTTKVTLPFIEEACHSAVELMGSDYWSYGLESNHPVLDTFLRYHHAQGLSSRRLYPEDLFDPTTLDTFKI
jgi:4,5-dihydroxyphthalate decarboxylase